MLKINIIILLLFSSLALAQQQDEDYLGCFKVLPEDIESATMGYHTASAPPDCKTECRKRYFMYSGLMGGQQCYCINKYRQHEPSNNCTMPCIIDALELCGSQDSMSVYKTGQLGPSPPRQLKVTKSQQKSLNVSWQPPDMLNGNVTSYTLHVVAVKTYASYPLFPTVSQVQGGSSENTVLTNLQPGTKYNISITATNEKGESDPANITAWTLIGPPDIPQTPKIIDRTDTTITVELQKGINQNGPLTSYQIVVVYPGTIPPINHSFSYVNYNIAKRDYLPYYITAEIPAEDFDKYNKKFIVGDGEKIGNYYNAPLKKPFDNPQIGMVLVSKNHDEIQYSYSNNNGNAYINKNFHNTNKQSTKIILTIAIVILGGLLLVSVVVYFFMRYRHEQKRITKLPEHQELTLQGPIYEVDNVAYIPEDIPERPNHYQDLKTKVWSIPKNFLNVEQMAIKRGRFGSIHMGTVQDKNGKLSQSIIHCISDQSMRASEKKNMLRELDICIKAGTMKFISSFIGNCETPNTLYIVFESPPYTLKNKLLGARSGENFPTEKILPIGSSIAMGLSYLESHKIIHSHLCARSIGLTDDFIPKIMGYGIGKYAIEDVKLARWTAPERFGHKKHIPGVVWSFGVVIWEMMSMGGTPYADLNDETDVEEAVVEKHIRLPQLRDMTDPLYEVLLSCWQDNYDERPGFDELSRLDTLSLVPITAITEPYLAELELN
ncbi:hypothetical protein HCN44_008385 [Aphidius gifuensis]|uniref:Tyrosine-protein kinase Wsck n=1 Tax=Aphidius gifuensis TaxID=684658 RepID=A0A834XMX9_APHGI|nr:putative tyrosine-protein kinase Wsck [Aphidius gifuensis]KAF7989711.1 hypothetical protein HCN44_008385 [Aphidius gifuensis]